MRRLAGRMLLNTCIAVLLAAPAAAEIHIGAVGIYPPDEVLGFCSEVNHLRRMRFPGASEWVIVGREEDYCAMPVEEVVDAVEALKFPIADLEMHILILPMPRLGLPNSSTEGNVVFLSPGRVTYPHQHVHYTATHEIGHVVHNLLMPDSRQDLWETYANLRKVAYSDPSLVTSHAWRLHEMFAEDFRVLFGGEIARCGGEVENHDLCPPDEVEGLREFFVSLLDRRADLQVRLSVFPNPFEADIIVTAGDSDQSIVLAEVTVLDVGGRIVRVIRPCRPDTDKITWDGKNGQGQPVAPGLYFITARSAYDVHMCKIVKVSR